MGTRAGTEVGGDGALPPALDTARRAAPEIAAAVAGLRPELDAVSAAIYARPETAFEEHHARDVLCEFLADHGFGIDKGVADLPTAFVATRGEGTPRLAFLVEYDALPGLGHGCGHNLIAAGGVVAAAAVAALGRPAASAGTLVVIGCPGEEGGGGKVLELERGLFDDVDAALMFHPADRTLPWRHARSSAHLHVRYSGRAAHAAKNPEDGRSALAGLIQLFTGLDAMRQYIGRSAQIHGVVRHGGDAPNVVPEHACADFLTREATLAANSALIERFIACAQGAALATGTTCEVSETAPRYSERKNNHAIAGRIAAYLRGQGVAVEPPSDANPSGSSDIGNVSLHLPIAHPYLAICERGTPGHSREMLAAAATPEAHDATEKMAVALAQTMVDLFEESGFLDAVQAEFARSSPEALPR